MTVLGSRGPPVPGRCVFGVALFAGASALLAPRFARGQDDVTFELRQLVTFALLPAHDYGVSGTCSTGTGVEPASIYAQGGSGRGNGFGAGVGGRVGFTHLVSPPGEGLTWWGVRAGAGLDLALMYATVDTGIGDTSGQLCARLKADGTQVGYQGSSVLLGQASVLLGAQMGMGSRGDDGAWHGLVLGAAWAPAMTWFKPWVSGGDVTASPLGTELTVDFATLARGTAKESGKRVALFLLLPTQDHGPLVVTASFGVVWF